MHSNFKDNLENNRLNDNEISDLCSKRLKKKKNLFGIIIFQLNSKSWLGNMKPYLFMNLLFSLPLWLESTSLML